MAEQDELSPQVVNPNMRRLAEALAKVKKGMNRLTVVGPRGSFRVEGGELLGQAPEEAERIAYGSSPFKSQFSGVSSRLPELQEKRKGPVVDLASSLPIGLAAKSAPALAAAVKGPGGFFVPSGQTRLGALLTPEGAPEHYVQWADRAVPRYMNRQLGTPNDPANRIPLGQGRTYENFTDTALRERQFAQLEPDDIPMNMGQGDTAWQFSPSIELRRFLQHAGDVGSQIPEAQLRQMSVPQLLQRAAQQQQLQGRQAANAEARQARAAARGDGPNERLQREMEMARQLTEQHPGGPYIQAPGANWYRFARGEVDPEFAKKSLSVDTCFGDNCIASAGYNVQGAPWPRYSPIRDLTTGQPHPTIQRRHGGAEPSTNYIDNMLEGKFDIYSLRTPEGMPMATSHTALRPFTGLRRSELKAMTTPREYLAWQRTMAERGVNPENIRDPNAPQNIMFREALLPNVGGGQNSPGRGMLGREQLQSFAEMYPKYSEMIGKMNQPSSRFEQYKGPGNYAVSPKWTEHGRELLGKVKLSDDVADSMGQADLMRSGLFIKSQGSGKGRIATIQELIEQVGPTPDLPQSFVRQWGPGAAPEAYRRAVELVRNPPNKLTQEESAMLTNLAGILSKHLK